MRTAVFSRDFNKLWAGQTVSLLGSALTAFALPTLAVLVLHAAPAQVGALAALQTLPFPVLGIFVGVLADRWPRRAIMIVADLARFAVLATVPVAALLGVLRMPQLYLVALASGIGSAFFSITYQSYLPVIVAKDDLASANVKLEISNSGAAIAGSAAAGALVQLAGAAAAIAVDAVSYLVSVISLAQIGTPEPAHDGPPLTPRQALREIEEGVATVRLAPNLRWIGAATATTNFGGAIVNAVTLIYAYRILRLQPGPLGVALGIAEIGFIGALLSTRIRARIGLRATLIGAIVLGAFANAAVLFAQFGLPYAVLVSSYAVAAVTVPVYNVNQVSYRQAVIDVHLQGRVNATMRTLVWGTLPLGALAGGYLAGAIGVRQTILTGSVIAGLAAIWLLPVHDGRPGHTVLQNPAAP